MVTYQKTIKINDERLIKFYIHENYHTKYGIEEYFIEDDEIKKTYRINIGDDYSFEGWVNENISKKEKRTKLSYNFDMYHPFYTPLNNLLGKKEELIIEDDETIGLNNKYMSVKREEDKIILSFINTLENDEITTKFRTYMKDAGTNDISKIKYYREDINDKLNNFFNEIINNIYQITLEEYIINEKGPENQETKKYMKCISPVYSY